MKLKRQGDAREFEVELLAQNRQNDTEAGAPRAIRITSDGREVAATVAFLAGPDAALWPGLAVPGGVPPVRVAGRRAPCGRRRDRRARRRRRGAADPGANAV